MSSRLVFCLLLVTLTGCKTMFSQAPGVFPHAAVAADHRVASQAGLEILRKGGNAVDAAVATSFTLSVVRPYACGIGGGGFMIIRFDQDPRHGTKSVAINYRETAPASVGPEYYEALVTAGRPDASTRGATAVGVPGTVAGLLLALEQYGSGAVDRTEVLAPAIRAAEEGFRVDAHYAAEAQKLIEWFQEDPARQQRFAFVWERFLRNGQVKEHDLIRLPEQAAALRLIAHDGADAFYNGPIREAIVRAIVSDGGAIAAGDLRGYRPAAGEPLTYRAFGRTFLTMPPPSSGGVAMAQILGILELRQVTPEPLADYIHLVTEAMKHAFADRARYGGDPAFVDVPVQRLISREYLRERAAKIDPTRTLAPAAYGTEPPVGDDGGTSHFCVVDRQGNAVSCTETINLTFGSLLAVPEYGFVLNNEMDDFTTVRGQANAFGLTQSARNAPAPGKRPLSSMTPTIVLDGNGDVEMIAGASGGPRIITGTLQAMLNVMLRDENAHDALRRARFHHQWQPNVLRLERGWRDRLAERQTDVLEDLRNRGHEIRPARQVGHVQIIRRTPDGKAWNAASDPRKGGAAAGY